MSLTAGPLAEQDRFQRIRRYADVALDLISDEDRDDDDGSDLFHLICGIQHHVSTRPVSEFSPLLGGGVAVALAFLEHGRGFNGPAVLACVKRIAALIELPADEIHTSLVMCVAEGWEPLGIARILMDET